MNLIKSNFSHHAHHKTTSYLNLCFWYCFNRLIASLLCIIFSQSVWANPKNINIAISNIEAERGGTLHILIFNNEHFPIKHAAAITHKSLPVSINQQEQVVIAIKQTEPIAIKVWHDEDDNNKVTKNWTGIYPAEGLGFSNNQTLGLTGPPSFEASKLQPEHYSKGVRITIDYP